MEPDITKDEGLEAIIHEAQKWQYGVYASVFKEHENADDLIKALGNGGKRKMISYGLIERQVVDGMYPLTEKGMRFKRFKDEDERLSLLAEKLKYEVKNIKRIYQTYWWVFGFSIASLVVSIILLILKSKEQ